MTEKKNYPEEIYKDFPTCGSEQGNIAAHMAGRQHAYDLGFRDGRFKERLEASNPLAGWSNLTEAIQAGGRIDWDALDGVEAKCVHPELGTLTYKMERDAECLAEEYGGWYAENCPPVWPETFYCSWLGRDGWSLYIKGDLPLRKLTADELEPGTIFEAVLTNEEEFGPATLLRVDAGIIDTGDWQKLDVDLTCIEVSRVLGTFQTPEEDA